MQLGVTLHVRAWIEISFVINTASCVSVTLHVRAWIEMWKCPNEYDNAPCHPPREGVD